MAINYNGQQAIADLVVLLKQDLAQLQQENIDYAHTKMRSQEARDGLSLSEIEEIATMISVSIIGDAWAVMDEWGTGSKMDVSNPAYAQYRASPMWNPARTSNVIVTRPDTAGQIDIFGREVKGKGAGGFDLEAAGKVKALEPSHAVRDAMKWMRDKRFVDKIHETLRHFPFGNYIIITNP